MDDYKALSRRMAVVVAVLALALVAGVQMLGERAAAPLLLVALVAVALVARGEVTGRSLLPEAASTVKVPHQREPDWYSERWVQENVERGLRSLERWRWEQSSS